MLELKKKFTECLVNAANESRSLGCKPSEFFEMLRRHGNDGVLVAEKLVKSGKIQTGLKRAFKVGRVDLSIESIMLRPEFDELFEDDILECAKFRLSQARLIA